jgi:radical SAM superfamily enzyme YgiQ (UPF0313 family)
MEQNPLVDFIIQGEYEMTAAALIGRLIRHEDPGSLKGLLYRTPAGALADTGRAELIEDLDALPWPERLLTPIYKYNDLFAGMQYPSLQVHASRGCPFGCIYCVWPQVLYGGRNYRARRPEAVMDEVACLVQEFGFQSVYFDDDTFNIGKKRMLALCAEFERRQLRIAWGAMARADTSDFETLEAMRRAGMVGIKFGVESGVQELVDRAGKGLDLKKVEEAVADCRRLGILTHLTFTFGLPGETPQTLRRTIDFAKALNPDSIQFSITTPFPGTAYFDQLKQSGHLLTETWERYDGARFTVVRTDALSAHDLEEALALAGREYNQLKLGQCRPQAARGLEVAA